MKVVGLVSTGSQAKLVIQDGEILLNGVVETRRKQKLRAGDKVSFNRQTLVVEWKLGRGCQIPAIPLDCQIQRERTPVKWDILKFSPYSLYFLK